MIEVISIRFDEERDEEASDVEGLHSGSEARLSRFDRDKKDGKSRSFEGRGGRKEKPYMPKNPGCIMVDGVEKQIFDFKALSEKPCFLDGSPDHSLDDFFQSRIWKNCHVKFPNWNKSISCLT
jgi:hypothetical protein